VPEIPDLVYIRGYLGGAIVGRTITGIDVMRPVVLRSLAKGSPAELLSGKRISAVETRGPFLRFSLTGAVSLVVNLMLAGKVQHQRDGEKSEGSRCLSLALDDGSRINICDPKQMAKVYIMPDGGADKVPRFGEQGVDVMSDDFTPERFRSLADAHRRKQVRVFLNDHRIISAIGNAYADEILFEARIHPKTFLGKLDHEAIGRLYDAIRLVLRWGIGQVAQAGQPIHVKVREHMKVRNRKGEPCPRCGATIRREGVRGYDVFFCPKCQPATRELFLDWRKIE
jgi:formamidopyrimidine-DNA glycosylase